MSKKAILGGLLPFISNPVVLAAVAIGAVGATVYEMLADKEGEQANGIAAVPNGSIPFLEPLDHEVLTVASTVNEPLGTVATTVEETVHSTVEEPYTAMVFTGDSSGSQQDETINAEAANKEIIRQAMSELGKRSAAARARKKNKI